MHPYSKPGGLLELHTCALFHDRFTPQAAVASTFHRGGNWDCRSLNGFLKSQGRGGAALSSDPTQCTRRIWKFTGTPQKTNPRSHYRVSSTSNTEIRAKDQDEVNNEGIQTPELLTVKTGRRPGKGRQNGMFLKLGYGRMKRKKSSNRRTSHPRGRRQEQLRSGSDPGQLFLISLLLSFSFTKILNWPKDKVQGKDLKSERKQEWGIQGFWGKFRSRKRRGNDVIIV